MTYQDPRALDQTAFYGYDDRPARSSGGDLHSLRLALDLQLDAMLLTLGASAHAGEDSGIPWRRWLAEDLEVAQLLTTALFDNESAPPVGLGGGFSPVSLPSALDDLVARYGSMEHILSGLLGLPYRGQPWRPAATEGLRRCRTRLEELHTCRRAVIAASAVRNDFLPGELLG